MMKEDVIRLNEQLKGKKAEEVLIIFGKYQDILLWRRVWGLKTVLTVMICGIDATTRILLWTLGCFETYSLIGRTNMTMELDSVYFSRTIRSGKNGGGTWGEFVLR